MKYTYIILVIIFLSVSCRNKVNYWGLKYQDLKTTDFRNLKVNSENIKTISIPSVIGNQKWIKASNLVDSCFAIALETNNNNLIGTIDEIRIYNGNIFILDKRIAKAVFVFNMDGKYLRRIGKNGRGPGEYPRPDGFEIDKKNKELLISSTSIRKILRYDFEGNFLGNIKPQVGNYDFKITDNGNIVLLAGDHENAHLGELKNRIVYVIDKKGNIISYGPSNSSDFKEVKMTQGRNLMANNYEITYSYKLSDTIYSINENEINAQYKIDFGKSGIDREELKSKNTGEFLKAVEKGENSPAFYLGTQFQTNDYLYFQFNYNKKIIDCFYNKNQSKTIAGVVSNDTPEIICVSPFFAAYKDYLIASVDAHYLMGIEEMLRKNNPLTHETLLKLVGSDGEFKIKKNDNPVLFFYKFKKEYNEN
jgi:hypothetical protein